MGHEVVEGWDKEYLVLFETKADCYHWVTASVTTQNPQNKPPLLWRPKFPYRLDLSWMNAASWDVAVGAVEGLYYPLYYF